MSTADEPYSVAPIDDDLADAIEETPPSTAEDLSAAEEMNEVLPSPAGQSGQVDDESDDSFPASDTPGNY